MKILKGPLATLSSILLVSCLNYICFRVKHNANTSLRHAVGEVNVTSPDILTTLCSENSCSDNCSIYRTPTSKCYNGHRRFPPIHDRLIYWRYDVESNPYGPYDILDEIIYQDSTHQISPWHFKRSFYSSTDGTCSGPITDSFDSLPFDECIGPFGAPLPWGMFELVFDTELKSDLRQSLTK